MLYPLKFAPIFKPRIWGGRRLEELFGKPLPAGAAVGESWELSGLSGDESVVANGPLAGQRLTELVNRFGPDLVGSARLLDGQFPLLIKLLDARQSLSVQVHPGQAAIRQLGPDARLKNECWYIVQAEPGARIWIGLNDGVDRERFAAAIATGQVEPLLHVQPVRTGNFFYLPAGTVHALGAGLVVAEVQTPSDTTYRLFDWNRVDGATGQPRTLHVAEALAAMDFAPPPPPASRAVPGPENNARRAVPGGRITAEGGCATCFGSVRLLLCDNFAVDKRSLPAGSGATVGGTGRMTVWHILTGRGRIDCSPAGLNVDFTAGELVLLPAAMPAAPVAILADCELLEITIPHE